MCVASRRLTVAIRDVESELAAMKAEQDPLASHIYGRYRAVNRAARTRLTKANAAHNVPITKTQATVARI